MTDLNTTTQASITGNAGQDAPALAETPGVPAAGVQEVIVGSELEAALAERAAKRADGPKLYFPWRGDRFQMQPVLPAGIGLTAARMQESGDGVHILRAIKQFFMPGEGDRFIDALTDPDSTSPPDEVFWQELMQTLMEAYAQRPLDS